MAHSLDRWLLSTFHHLWIRLKRCIQGGNLILEKGTNMKIEHFKMERMQSTWEFHVTYNLSESGVHPLSLSELVKKEEMDSILKIPLGYIQTNGTSELREKICQLYPGSNIENILVTTGSVEANYLLIWSSVEPGDEVVFMLPNYMQIWGLARAFGAKVKSFFLKEEREWDPDPDELRQLITDKTKIIAITNPNNPTGSRLSEKARQTIIELADRTGAWIFSDEVYQGAERDGKLTPSFWGTYEKVAVSSGLSKAYGLPGLRVGWIAAPEEFIQRTWPYHDYTTISISAVSDRLARIALSSPNRENILERSRSIIRKNYSIIQEWFQKQQGLFHCVPTEAGAIVLARYNLDIDSLELINRLREQKSVLLVPGAHFEMGRYIRFGFGDEEAYLKAALARVEEGILDYQNS
jgi:aspartate/methionine/tyrosine aminotransferase